MSEMNRRHFLKVSGAFASVPLLPTEPLPVLQHDTREVVIDGLVIGTSIGIFNADTMDVFFLGKVAGHGPVTVELPDEDDVPILIRARHRNYHQIELPAVTISDVLQVHLQQVVDPLIQ